MHGDEAVHALKFGELLEGKGYRYDSYEYHGPTLNYFTLIPAWLASSHQLTEVSEKTLRLVPVFFGTVLVAMTALLLPGLSRPAVACAAMLTAVSPAMAYYSRYYIQEMLLVCFTFGVIACGYRYGLKQNYGWALATGVFGGLMHATKETCIIAWGALALAAVLALMLENKDERDKYLAKIRRLNRRHVATALLAAAAVSMLFYSSFFTNARGVLDSFLAYETYLSRAGHNPVHIHPWHYYLRVLSYFRLGANPFWSEALILMLAAAGFIAAMKRRKDKEIGSLLLRFIAFYALIMAVAYSLIPYKTPWNLISFLHGMILLAGFGAVEVISKRSHVFARGLAALVLLAGGAHLAWQAYLANHEYGENPANPYVYAHPVNDVFTIVRRVEEIAQAQPQGHNMYMQIICPDDDYWPLPWYLRAYTNIGWWREVDAGAPAAPLIIAAPQFEPALMHKFYESPPPGQRELYVPLFDAYTELRPRLELRGYVRKEAWDRFQERREQAAKEKKHMAAGNG